MSRAINLTCMMVLLAGVMPANTITWANNLAPTVFSTGTSLSGPSLAFLDNTNTFGLTLTALLASGTGLPNATAVGNSINTTLGLADHNLGWKNENCSSCTGEHGVGIMTQADAEIRGLYLLQFDLTPYQGYSFSIAVDSIDASEGVRLWTSNSYSAGSDTLTLLTKQVGGSFVQTFSVPSGVKYLYVSSDTADSPVSSLVVRSLTATSVPETSTMLLAGVSLMAIGLWRRRP